MPSSAPPPPDYTGAAQQQANSQNELLNQQTAANRPNVNNAWGSSTWQRNFDGTWTNNQTLSPDQQASLGSQFDIQKGRLGLADSLLGRMAGEMGSGLDTSKLTAWGAIPQADEAARQAATDAVYNQATSRLDPQWNQQETSTRNRLYAMGLKEGDPAYDREMGNLQRAKTDAYNQANYSSIGAGQQALQNQFQMGMGAANLADQQRLQQIGEQGTQQGWTLGQINGLINGMGVNPGPQGATPNATAGQGMAPEYLQAMGLLGNYNLQNAQQQNSFWGGLASGLGGMVSGVGKMFKL